MPRLTIDLTRGGNMKICALTMVYKDYWALGAWYRHYAQLLGADALYIVAHGADPKVQQICPGASVWTIPRDDLSYFDRKRAKLLNAFQAGLLSSYDWVIRTDVDELICTDPGVGSLQQIFAAAGRVPVLTALGLDLVEQASDGCLSEGLWSSRKNASFTGHYSKSFAHSRPVNLTLHGTKVRPQKLPGFPFVMPEGVYLVHLKYANLNALEQVNADRITISTASDEGLPGAGWREADTDAAQFLTRFEAKPVLPWHKARAKAFRALSSDPTRSERLGVVKTRALKFPFRTTLPDWFETFE